MAVTDETLLIAADTRRRLQSMTDDQVVELTRAWIDAWDDLSPLFTEAVVDLLQGVDGRLTRAMVSRNRRLQSALKQARTVLMELAKNANEIVTNDLSDAVLDAVGSHEKIIRSQLPPQNVGISIDLDAPATGALDAIVTRTTHQIHARTKPLAGWVVKAMRTELVRGIAVGDNPNEVARKLIRATEGHFNGGLARATRIARTELLDAHRKGSQAAAMANAELLVGWKWSCTLDRRSCASCIAKHGTVYPADHFGPEDHPNGRCARIDIIKSWRELGFDIDEPADAFPDARAWYENLDEQSQLAIMGPTRRELLANGKVSWDDLSTVRHAYGWRDSYVQTPVKDLLGSVAG